MNRQFCSVFGMYWTETDVNETKITIFCYTQKGEMWNVVVFFLVCAKDVNALLITVIRNSPRKLNPV